MFALIAPVEDTMDDMMQIKQSIKICKHLHTLPKYVFETFLSTSLMERETAFNLQKDQHENVCKVSPCKFKSNDK